MKMAKRWTALAMAATGLTLFPAAPTLADPSPTTTALVEQAGAAIAGPLEGAPGSFFFALDAFVHIQDGQGEPSASAQGAFATVECLTQDSEVRVVFTGGPAIQLDSASAIGEVTGSCFDFQQQVDSPYRARFAVRWRGTGPIEREAFISRPEGQVCLTVVSARNATASGRFVWSAPGLGIGGTGTPVGLAEMHQTNTLCRAA
jgi:hypothetical protein